MKLSKLSISNVLGAAEVALDPAGHVLSIVAGPNASGKSSTAEAVRLAMFGASERAPAKRDWQLLVTEGALSGAVQLEFDSGETARISLPSGRGDSPIGGLDPMRTHAWSVAFGNLALSTWPAKDRRTLVTKLFGTASAHDEIAARLLERKHSPDLVEAIKPLLRAGVDAAKAEAQDRAKAAKGAWREVTSEVWGEKKAAEWSPPGDRPTKPKRTASELMRLAAAASSDIEALQRKAGAAANRISDDELAKLRAIADDRPARIKARDEARTRRDEIAARRSEIDRTLSDHANGKALQCPCCEAALRLVGSVLAQHRPLSSSEVEALRADAKVAHQDYQSAEDELTQAQRAVDVAQQAQAKVDVAAGASALDPDEIDRQIEEKCDEHAALLAEVDQVRQYDAWDSKRTRAADRHREIVSWLALATDLGDPAIGSTEAQGPAEALNAALSDVCAGIGWAPVTLSEEGELYYGGRPVRFCSVSERWRADAALAVTFARVCNIGMVLLDQVDVLEPQARGPLFKWLAEASGLETALCFITLKMPPQMPSNVATLWLGTGPALGVAA